jgi:tRNA (guanine-N7-)-methyltransferase
VSAGRPAPQSYVARHGRLTPAQKRALELLGPRFLLLSPASGLLDPEEAFGRPGPLLVEIGSGNGAFLVAQARARPERLHLGVEVYPPGLGHTLLEIERHDLENVRLLAEDAFTALTALLPPACAERIVVLFPDPWPKKRHHKRRLLLRPGFWEGARQVLVPEGRLLLVTDAGDYAEEVRAALVGTAWRETAFDEDLWTDAQETPFARRARKEGHPLARLAVSPTAV